MLYYFLLIFPTWFKGVLTTYHIQLSSYFSQWVFGREILKMIEFTQSNIVYKGILMDTQEDFKTIPEDLEDYTTNFEETVLSRGGVRNRLA
jgi:hypothetical protein